MKPPGKRSHTEHGMWFRLHMPYHFVPLGDNLFLPVNREYKPLGLSRTQLSWAVYQEYSHQAMLFKQDIAELEGIWWKQPLWLYNDAADSFKDYEVRLGKLLSLMPRLGRPS